MVDEEKDRRIRWRIKCLSRSAVTTQLASDVGSTVGPRTNLFLKSITFFDWKIYYIRHRPLEKDEKKEDSPSEEDIGEGCRAYPFSDQLLLPKNIMRYTRSLKVGEHLQSIFTGGYFVIIRIKVISY